MARERTNGLELSADRYPDPFCVYRLDRGVAVIRGANEAFVDAFGTDSGEALKTAFDGLDVEGGVLAKRLANGGRFTLRGETASYRVRAVPLEDEIGQLVFAELSDAPDELGIGHVASVVAHDLRNPLDVAKARLEAGRESGEDEHFEHVARAHDRMERIIQDVLTLARGEEVVEPDNRVPIDQATRAAWNNVATEHASLSIAGHLPTTIADPDRVGRLLENLFRNAIEHGPGDEDDRSVSVTVGPLENGFYVADDGYGIPEQERERVFAPGYSGGEYGTGLGLATVSRIVEVHGWSISVTESAAGGARFELRGLTAATGDT